MFKRVFDIDGKFDIAYDNLIEETFGLTGNIQLYSSEKLQNEINKLGGKKKQVLEMRYGLLEGTLPKTYEEIGKKIGLSGGRVNQILRKARHLIRCREIRFIRDFNEIKSNEFVTDEKRSKIDEIEATLDKICMGENIDDIDAKGCLDYLREIKDRIEKEERKKQEKEAREKQMKGISIGIGGIGFSVRTYNCLKRHGINHLEDLSNITEDEFIEIRYLGEKAVAEVKYAMELYGISFKNGAEIKTEGEDFPKIKRIRLEKEMGGICIEKIGFSKRTYYCLKRYGINHLEDLLNITEKEFLKINGLGKYIAAEVKNVMELHGISFKDGAEIKLEGEDFPKIKRIRLERDIKSSQNLTEEQQQEVQEGKKTEQEETSTNSKEELESMSSEELQRTIDENDKTIYENDQALKKKLVERILEQQRIIAEQQNQISQLKNENKEL